jgi:hypothetical protein
MAAPVITKFVHAILVDCARSFFLSSSSFCLLLNIRRSNKGLFITHFERLNFPKNSLACLASIIQNGIN